jgi:hypothetical protein
MARRPARSSGGGGSFDRSGEHQSTLDLEQAIPPPRRQRERREVDDRVEASRRLNPARRHRQGLGRMTLDRGCGSRRTEHVAPIRAAADDEHCGPSGDESKDVHGGLRLGSGCSRCAAPTAGPRRARTRARRAGHAQWCGSRNAAARKRLASPPRASALWAEWIHSLRHRADAPAQLRALEALCDRGGARHARCTRRLARPRAPARSERGGRAAPSAPGRPRRPPRRSPASGATAPRRSAPGRAAL